MVDLSAVVGSGASDVRSYGMLSTFPPTACGIATFSAALSTGLLAHGATVGVVRCGEREEIEDPLVVGSTGDEPLAAADALNRHDTVDLSMLFAGSGIIG